MAESQRTKLALRSGIVGIICNIILCAAKIFTGIVSSSVSVIADGINNLSDAASNIVTIIGTKLSQKPNDKEHPFGHGRFEYISAMIVAFLILLMGVELIKGSVKNIIYPSAVQFNWWNLAILCLAVAVKLGMAIYNHILYRKTDNINLKAVKQDSLNDCIATLATITALLISAFTKFQRADGIIGTAVSILVIVSGIEMIKETLNPLLGQAPSKEMVDEIEKIILKQDLITGVHDLIIHNYGPGTIIASAHAEVPDNVDVIHLHNAIDAAENEILEKMNINICLHMDPVAVNNKKFESYKALTARILDQYNPDYKFHDFKMTEDDENPENPVLVFDLVIPFSKCEENHTEILKNLCALFKSSAPEVRLNIRIEHSYV